MPIVLGVDGCSAGWIAAAHDLTLQTISTTIYRSVDELMDAHKASDVIAVDIPIGLTSHGPRQCDTEARRALGQPRASSVFPSPIRDVLNARTREEASGLHRRIDGRGFGAQSWGILPKIKAWDLYLREHKVDVSRVFEVHPEVCFWKMNAQTAMEHRKTSNSGRRDRYNLLVNHFDRAWIEQPLCRYLRKDVATDDVYDAFVALWTAERLYKQVACCLPNSALLDTTGLRMSIWY